MAADARESSRPSANAVPPNRATTNDGFMRAMISVIAPGTPNVGPIGANATVDISAVSSRA